MTTPAPRIEVHESGWQRWALRLLPALTFLVGIGLGAVVVLAGQTGGSAPEPGAEPSAAPSDPEAAGAGADTVVTLPAACEAAAQNINEATRLIDDVAEAVRDFRPDELVELLDRLEDLDSETGPLAAECSRVDVSESPSSATSEEPSAEPSDEPSEEPAG